MHMRNLLLFFTLLALGVSSCIDPPTYPVEPEIEFLSISRDTIDEIVDTFSVRVSFTDGDGDLGFSQSQLNEDGDTSCTGANVDNCDSTCFFNGTTSIIVIDKRTNCFVPFNLPEIPPKGSSAAISGTITITFANVLCFPDGGVVGQNPDIDTARFEVRLRDRSGNISLPVETPIIFIDCRN